MRRLLLAAAALIALTAPAPAAADVDVQITAFGYDPADVTVRPGEAIHWTNVLLLGQSVTSGAGLFDSGIVPPGGGYSMATSVPGLHVYGSSSNPAIRGTIRVLSPRLGGDPAAPAADAIPDLPFPPPRTAEVAEHPTYGVGASTTRVLLGVETDATVGDVNDALASVQAEVLGGLPRLGILLVQVSEEPTWTEGAVDVGRFTGLTAALGRLRASSAFEFAAMSTEVEQAALPRRADEAAESLPGVWHWDGAGGANWGPKDARFPFAWNLRESIARDEPSVVTGIVDGGFYDHPDLTQLEVRQQLCPTGGGCVATPNNGDDDFRTHGTHVAGIIGAAWDNPASLEPPRSPRSKGVSGGNPFARLVGTSFAAANLYDTTVGLFDAFLRSRPDELRVINFSGKMVSPDPAALAASFPLPTCGPGEADDDLPGFQAGTTFACTPNIEDGWLRQVAAAGMAARRVAAAAAEDGVVIVAASGNDSDTYCTPFGDPSCVTRPIRASHAAEFAWASEHWEDDVANPIFVVEATAPNGRPTRFSNPGGDIAAPGLDVGSTVGSGGYGLLSGTSMAAPHVSAAIGYLLAAEPDLTTEGIRERVLDWGRQPPPATPPPEHVFDWNVPDHLGHDADLDAIVDPHDSSADVVRDGYPVELDACDWSVGGDPIVKFTWTLNGETLERTTCRFRYTFPAEGSYAVTVTFTDADGDDHTGTRTVTVDDLLVVAVGDALAAGEGNPDELGSSPFAGARWQDGRCHRSARGGVAQAPRWLEIANTESSVTFVDFACSGARIRGDRDANGTLVPGPDGEGGLLTPYGGAEPDATPLAPQLDDLAALRGSRTVDALVLYAGAGDLRLREILLDCLRPGNNCATGAGLALFQQRQPLLAGRYDELAARLAELGVAADRVFAGEYPDFTRSSGGAPDLACVPGGAVTAAEATWLAETVLLQLNAAVQAAATRHGWTAIGGVADDFRTHGYCAGDPWVNTATAAELERLALGDPAVAGAFHPNIPGQAALASRVVAAIHGKLGLGPVNARRLVGDAAPRLDVFASLLAAEGIARRLVDVNDPSRDGNRRVVRDLDAEGAITTSLDRLLAHADGERTEPDGDVDMRDFRRFRDAWLLECLLRTGDTACPASSSDIELDGGDDHPKRDLNIDGCVRQGGDPAGCGAAEYEYSRFDFNGDGHTSVERRAFVPLTAEGTPAARPWDAAKLTDLDLLRGQWSPSPRADEGWEAGDLERLLRSGDVTVHPGRLLAHGAREGEVQVQTLAGEAVGTARTLKRRDGSLVVTVPVADPTAALQVVGTASTARGTVTVRSTPFSLRYGEDVRADLCAGLNLEASSLRLPTEGQAESTFTATLHRCGAEPELGGKVVSWTVSPETSGGPQLDAETTATDGSGRSSIRLRSGTEAGSYTIKATVDLGAGETEAAELSVTLVAPVTIRYAWRQEVAEWSEEGSTKWEPFLDPLRPDCLTAGVEYCIDTFRIALDPDSPYELERSGRLTGIDDHVRLTETVSNSLGRARSTWTVSRPNEQPQDGGELTEWSVTDPTRYADHALADVTIEDADDGIHLRGLQVVGDLPYHYSLTAQSFPGADAPREVHSTRREFLLVPQGEGRHLRFAAHPEHELMFPRTGGGFERFASCGQLEQDLTTEPGYLVLDEEEDEFLSATSLRRKPDFEPGDRPMPVGPGTLHVRYAFAATVGYDGEEPPEPELPPCAGDEAPVADFELPPEPVDEGEVVQFRDASTDADHDIATYEWETSSPAWALSLADLVDREPWAGTAGSASPSFVFADEGPVTVKLTVTDSAGETATVDKALTVMNVPPEASLDDADAEVGTEARISYRVLDASHVDRAALRVRITSSHPAWAPIDRVEQAGVHFQTRLGLPAGTYPLTLTVTDPDGATTRDSATLVVSSVPPDDEHPGGGASPTCEPTVVLDSEERDFLELVNDYRDANGLPPVTVSPTLTRAAERHAADMAENDFLDHTGSDGSTAGERAWDAGYPRSAAVGENLTEGAAGFDALWSWRGSVTGHNENMLVPEWRAVGISRVEGSVWKWATSYGNKLDCPGAGQPAPPGPEATGLDATFSGTEAGGEALDEPAMAALAGESSPFSLRFADLAAASEMTAAPHENAAAETPTALTVAFTLSDATPREGTPVVFTNRSRDATGTPVSATLHLDAPTEVALGPEASTSHAFPTAGARSVRLVAGDAELARPLDVAQKLPLTLDYLGPATAYAGGRLDVLVRADDSAAAVPVAGAELTFELAGATAAATTGPDGRAAALLAVPTALGSYELTVGFAGNDDFLAAQISATIEVLANAPPVADAGGPYVLGEGQALFLDGTRSRDADAGDRVARYAWDLDGDGSFTDAAGPTPAALPWETIETLVCGGACATGQEYPLALRVEDSRGASATAGTTVRVTADFAVVMAGGTITLVPGASNSFGVTVVGSSSWTQPVTLAVEGLPPGVTASFNRNPVTPTGTSVLTLTASSSAPNGSFAFTVTGTSNGVTRVAGAEVDVTFGLIPKCFGTFAGTVTDRDTGEPLANAGIYLNQTFEPDVVTDENGRYVIPNIELGLNNAPLLRGARAAFAGFWEQQKVAEAACGVVTRVDFSLRLRRTGQVSGRVVDKDTGAPLPGVLVWSPSTFPEPPRFTTDADGRFAGALELNPDNAPRTYSYLAELAGYWSKGQNFTVTAESGATVSYELVRKCFGTVRGGTVHRLNTTIPVAGLTVHLTVGTQLFTATTDAQGVYRFDREVPLGQDNQPVTYSVSVGPPPGSPSGSQGSVRVFQLSQCGQVVDGLDLTVYVPTQNFGTVDGFVRDQDSGEPVAGAVVEGGGIFTNTDATGYYRLENVFVGNDAVTTRSVFFNAARQGYHSSGVTATFAANTTTRVDLTLLRVRFGTAVGTVTEALTGALIAGASVSPFSEPTGNDGGYRATVSLGFRNAPVTMPVTATATGYWPQQQQATYRADEATTADFQLVRECAAARVTGRVVNALTQEPIPNAFVQTQLGHFGVTDADGRFVLTGLRAGVNNAPVVMTLTASAPGFNFAQRQITIFCGANIVVDFGNSTSNTASIAGTVTNLDTGQPIPGASVGAEFGAVATTDASGNFRFPNVPLGHQDADREWKVTATVQGFRPLTLAVVARANQEARADFGFTKAGNTLPVADPKTYVAHEDVGMAPQPLKLTGSDADGDALTFHIVRHPLHGRVRGFPPDVDYVATEPNYHGPDSFEYATFDGQDLSLRATVDITVLPVNDSPRATNDAFQRPLGAPARIPIADILANDTDADGDTLSLISANAFFPAQARIEGNELVVTPATNQTLASALYSISDGNGAFANARIDVSFVATPLAPVCADASFGGPQDELLSGRVLCTDGNGDALTHAVVGGPETGTLSFQPDGTFEYEPPTGFSGSVEFDFTASDAALTSAPATVTLVLEPTNSAPAAADGTVALDEDASAPLTLSATDADGDTLAFAVVTPPAHGTLSGTPPALTYTPAADYHGPDSFTFRASDDTLADEATVSITVRPVNDPPAAAADTAETNEDEPLALAPAALLANDADVDGDLLTLTAVGEPVHGTVALAGGTIVFTPAAGFGGTAGFDYTVEDGHGASATAHVTVTVRSLNDAPDAEDARVALDEDTPAPITLAAGDPDGDPLGFTVVSSPAHGTLSGTAPNLTYTPSANYHGPDSFGFRASDGTLADEATVSITVRPVNDEPIAADDAAATNEDEPLELAPAALLANDTDADGDPLTVTAVGGAAHGTVVLQAGNVVFSPAPSFSGAASFTYTISDGQGGMATAGVAVTVAAVNRAPAVELAGVAPIPEATAVTLTATGSDPDGDALTYSWHTTAGELTATGATAHLLVDDGPAQATVTVRVTDAAGESAEAGTVVDVVNIPPRANAGPDRTTPWGLPLSLSGTVSDPARADTTAGLDPRWSSGAEGLTAELTFAEPGVYLAALTATDKDGDSSSDIAQVRVDPRGTALTWTGEVTDPSFGHVAPSARLADLVHAPTALLGGRTVTFHVGGQSYNATTDTLGDARVEPALVLAPGSHAVRVAFAGDDRYDASETVTTVNVGAPARSVLVLVDENALDNGAPFHPSGGAIVPSGPSFFGRLDVNADRAGVAQRAVLRYFASRVGSTITIRTGQTGDEGWFAPACIPQRWLAGTSSACLTGGARDSAIDRFFGRSGAASIPSQGRLEKVPAVLPLRARGLLSLVGENVCAVVYDGDVGLNYSSSSFPYTEGNLQGAVLGLAAFDVKAVRRLSGFSSSTLPEVQLTIRDPAACSGWALLNAPVPRSTSVPNDVDPARPAGTGSSGYRTMLVRPGEALFL